MKRIIERAHVGIDLLLKCSGEKTQALAGFHCRPRENNSSDLLGEQRGYSHRHSQVGFSRSAGADRENHVKRFERFHIARLIGTLRRDAFFAERADARGRKSAAQLGRWGCGRDTEQRFHFLAGRDAAFAHAVIIFTEDLGRALYLSGGPFDFEVMILQMGRNVQG